MMTLPDFEKKQIIFVFLNIGEKISFSNDNLVVKDKDDKTKLQTTCYRIFALFVIGEFSITTGLVQRAQKFTFPIYLLTGSMKLYDKIGYSMDGNVILRRKQYNYKGLELARFIVSNKILNQLEVLKTKRNKSDDLRNTIEKLNIYIERISETDDLQELMGIEGNSAKIYFKHEFDNIEWRGRKPRVKNDYVNSALDIGYTVLFNIVEALLDIYGFDTYCGFLHREFYRRKSLVCDMVEPFRVIIDEVVRKGVNLKQIKEEDFNNVNGSYRLKWEKNRSYILLFVKAVLDYKKEVFLYFQSFYRAFMKSLPTDNYLVFKWGG